LENIESKEIKITEIYLKEVLDYVGASLVGKICKKFEIIENNNSILKSVCKETIYEEMRHLRDILLSYSKGLEMTQFNFKTQK